MATHDPTLPPGSDSSPLHTLTSANAADEHLVRIFERRVKASPEQPVWVAYRFRTVVDRLRLARPRRVYRLMVHLPGTEITGFVGEYQGLVGWARWRAQVQICQLHPVLRTARWP